MMTVAKVNRRPRIEGRSVSMYPADWALLEAKAQELGLGVSATLRLIVREALSHPSIVEMEDGGDGRDV